MIRGKRHNDMRREREGRPKMVGLGSDLQGLLEKMAVGMWLWSSSVKYFGRGHLGRAVEGPLNEKNRVSQRRERENERQWGSSKQLVSHILTNSHLIHGNLIRFIWVLEIPSTHLD